MTDTQAAAGGAADHAAAAAAAATETQNSAAAPGDVAANGGQTPGQAEPSPAGYRPEGLPDHLYGATDRETIDKLHKAYGPAREFISRAGSVPDDPAGYAWTPSEAVAPYVPDHGNDPVVKITQQAAKAAGIGDKAYGTFMGAIMDGLVGSGMLDDPYSADAERAIIAGDVTDPAERTKAADKASREAIGYVDMLAEQGKIGKDTADFIKGRSDRGHMIRFIQAARAMAAPASGVAMGGGGATGQVTRADLQKRQADPRNQFGNPAYDAEYAAETNRLYQAVVPDEAAGA